MSTVKLINPTDDELSAAVAIHVAKWKLIPRSGTWKDLWENEKGRLELDGPWFAWSAGAVLPLLEKWAIATSSYSNREWTVSVMTESGEGEDYSVYDAGCGEARTFAYAACIALLRANGIEVEVTP